MRRGAEWNRFLAEIARAAVARGDAESLNLADEAWSIEALEDTEGLSHVVLPLPD